MQNVHFTPPEIARLLSVNESTVKRWIDRGILTAERTAGGHRRVSSEDLQAFLKTQDTARKHSYVLSRFSRALAHDAWEKYFDLHRGYRPSEARQFLVSSLIASGSVLGVIQTIILPSLVQIGLLWRNGQLDIADEHRMTFLMRADLHALDEFLPVPKKRAPCALLACVPNENHELMLQLASLVLREAGWRTIVLGINVPAPEILRAVSTHPVAMVVLTKQYRTGTSAAYVRSIRTALPSDVTLLIGGNGWSEPEQAALARMHNVSHCPSLEALSRSARRGTGHAAKSLRNASSAQRTRNA